MNKLRLPQSDETAPENAEVISRDEDGMAVLFWELPGLGGYGLGGYRAALKDMDVDLIVASMTYPSATFTREQARAAAIRIQRSVTFDQKVS